MNPLRDEFLSEEDLDLRNLSEAELLAVWDAWLVQAQATNEADAHEYTHGVFASDPPPRVQTPPDPRVGAGIAGVDIRAGSPDHPRPR